MEAQHPSLQTPYTHLLVLQTRVSQHLPPELATSRVDRKRTGNAILRNAYTLILYTRMQTTFFSIRYPVALVAGFRIPHLARLRLQL